MHKGNFNISESIGENWTLTVNWKQIALYILRIVELVITGAAGGAITQL